jgi:hypothetical protein
MATSPPGTEAKAPGPAPAARYLATLSGTIAAVLVLPALLLVAFYEFRPAGLALTTAALFWFAASALRRRQRTGGVVAVVGMLLLAVLAAVTDVDPALRYATVVIDIAAAILLWRAWPNLRR